MKVARSSLNLWIPDLGATTTGVVSRTIGVGPVPGQVAITPDGKYAYETDMDGVSVTKTKTGMGSVRSGDHPDGKHMNVTNSGAAGTVWVITTKTGAVIAVGSSPNSWRSVRPCIAPRP